MPSARLVRDDTIDPGRALAPATLAAVPRYGHARGFLTRYDDVLRPVAERPLDLPGPARLHDATPDLRLAVAAEGSVLVVDRAGDGSLVDLGAAVERATPVGPDRIVVGLADGHGGNELALVDAAGTAVLDRTGLDTRWASFLALAHPTDGSVVLDAARGQDGNDVFAVRTDGDRLTVRSLAGGLMAAAFDPTGTRLLLIAHHGPEVRLAAWPEGRLQPVPALPPVGMSGCFVGDHVVLELDGDDGCPGLLLCDADLAPLGHLDLPGGPGEGAEIEALYGLGRRTFAVDRWCGDRNRTSVFILDP